MGVVKTGKGTAGRSIKIMQNLGKSYGKSLKSTTDVTRNLAQSARSATRKSVIGKAAGEFSRVNNQREAQIKSGSFLGQSTKGFHKDPRKYGKLLTIKAGRNAMRIGMSPVDLGKSLHGVNKAMYGDSVSSASRSLEKMNKKTLNIMASPFRKLKRSIGKKNKKQDIVDSQSSTLPVARRSRSKQKKQLKEENVTEQSTQPTRNERKMRSQIGIDSSAPIKNIRDLAKSFNEHRELLRKGSVDQRQYQENMDDTDESADAKTLKVVNDMSKLIKSSSNKYALKEAILTLAGLSSRKRVNQELLDELNELLGSENMKILEKLGKNHKSNN